MTNMPDNVRKKLQNKANRVWIDGDWYLLSQTDLEAIENYYVNNLVNSQESRKTLLNLQLLASERGKPTTGRANFSLGIVASAYSFTAEEIAQKIKDFHEA